MQALLVGNHWLRLYRGNLSRFVHRRHIYVFTLADTCTHPPIRYRHRHTARLSLLHGWKLWHAGDMASWKKKKSSLFSNRINPLCLSRKHPRALSQNRLDVTPDNGAHTQTDTQSSTYTHTHTHTHTHTYTHKLSKHLSNLLSNMVYGAHTAIKAPGQGRCRGHMRPRAFSPAQEVSEPLHPPNRLPVIL